MAEEEVPKEMVDEQDKEAAAKGDHVEEAKGDHTEQAKGNHVHVEEAGDQKAEEAKRQMRVFGLKTTPSTETSETKTWCDARKKIMWPVCWLIIALLHAVSVIYRYTWHFDHDHEMMMITGS